MGDIMIDPYVVQYIYIELFDCGSKGKLNGLILMVCGDQGMS
jgi:hypothetical protein